MRTRQNNITPTLAAVALAGLISLGGCATSSGGAAVDSAGVGEKPQPIAIEPWDGDGMEIPLDGRSLAHFDAYMARVKKYASADDYTSLEGAIDYLLLYDLSAKRDKEKLISDLDGLTGYEILSKVRWRKPAPGKSKAEKGAADAKIFDT